MKSGNRRLVLSTELYHWVHLVPHSITGAILGSAWFTQVVPDLDAVVEDSHALLVGEVWLARNFPRAFFAALWSDNLKGIIEPTQDELDAALDNIKKEARHV